MLTLVILLSIPFTSRQSAAIIVIEDSTGIGTPVGNLAMGDDSVRYGITAHDGIDHCGVVYRITPAGNQSILHVLNRIRDGCESASGLLLAGDGNLYGTTTAGGPFGLGTVFRVTPAGEFTRLHAFGGDNSLATPVGHLTEGKDGHLYGVTRDGGQFTPGKLPATADGAVYRITKGGELTILHTFSLSEPVNGWGPDAGLIMGSDDNLYGTTAFGGNACQDCGTLFRITTEGDFTLVQALSNKDEAAVNRILATIALSQLQLDDPSSPPEAPLLDDFNRPNATTLGTNWIPLASNFAGGSIGISGNEAMAIGDGPQGAYWNTLLDTNQEAYGKYPFNKGYDDIGIAIRYNPTTGNGYAVLPNNAGPGTLALARIQNNAIVTSYLASQISGNFTDGSWVGIRAIDDHITVWHSSDGVTWTQVLEATDAGVSGGGYAALWLNNLHTFDDFHAGNLVLPPPVIDDGGDPGNGGDPGTDTDPDADPGNGDGGSVVIDETPVPIITGSPGGGRRGGVALGAAGIELIGLLVPVFLLRRRIRRDIRTQVVLGRNYRV